MVIYDGDAGNTMSFAELPMTVNLAVPTVPLNVRAIVGKASATVVFTTPNSDGGRAISGYTVTSNPAAGLDTNSGSTALRHLVTGLTNGTRYTFTVTATNAVGVSGPSDPSNSVIPTPAGNQAMLIPLLLLLLDD